MRTPDCNGLALAKDVFKEQDGTEKADGTYDTALILIDMQLGAISTIQSMDQQEFNRNAIALAKVCPILQLSVISAAADIASDHGRVLPELTDRLPDAIRIQHATNNAWETPGFVRAIEQTGCKTLAIAGLATDVGYAFPPFQPLRLVTRARTRNGFGWHWRSEHL
ncbi:MAG: isochorismatase family protein [Leptolyngbya sp. BL-A-14]